MTEVITPRRQVLQELHPLNPHMPLLTRMSPELSHNILPIPDSFLTPSPEEEIIRLRRRSANAQHDENATPATRSARDSRKRLILSPPKTPCTPGKDGSPVVKRQKLALVDLGIELKGYAVDQLAELVGKLVENHPEIEEEVRDLVGAPDLRKLEQNLSYLKHNIYRAFPSRRWNNPRDAHAYMRVKGHLTAFKKSCLQQARVLLDSKCFDAVIKYVERAWTYTSQLPDWEDVSHNQVKKVTFQALAAFAMKAIRQQYPQPSQTQLRNYKARLDKCQTKSAEMSPVLRHLNKLIIPDVTPISL